MLKYIVMLAVTSFLLGFTLHSLIGTIGEAYSSASLAEPGSVKALVNPQERISPYPRITKDQIQVLKDRVVIELENPQWATFTDTNSMDPVFDAGHFVIQEVPQSEQDIHVGDIITYSHPSIKQGNLIHRVIKVGYDESGWYAIAKGDNNTNPDPGKVRYGQIKKVVAAIIY